MSSKANRDALIKQFRALTNATPADSQRLMKQANYRVEQAVEAFYSDAAAQRGAASSSSANSATRKESEKKLGAIFDEYRDEDEESGAVMTIEGTMSYCEALGVSPEDVVLLPLSFYLQSPTMGQFNRDAFINGWRTMADGTKACDTVQGQKEYLPTLTKELQTDAAVKGELGNAKGSGLYKRTYEYTYNFARPEGQKSVPLDTALAFWDLLLPHSPTFSDQGGSFTQAQYELWKRYLTDEVKSRTVSKDTWSLFLDFTRDIDPDFTTHDFEAAWPSTIDGFVTWAKEQKGKMDES
ncbi:unnamed protein product [Jaminaea pallidilutea]